VAAAGNSSTRRNYSFTDDISSLLQNDIIYYRIRQVDIDSRYKVSNIAVVKLSKTMDVRSWPNPFTSFITVNVTAQQNTELTVRLTDLTGRTILTQKQQASRGVTQISVNSLNNLESGVYLLDITDEVSGNKTTIKCIKEK
jgi:hypothetical protein